MEDTVEKQLITGIKINLGGRDLIIPPLNFRQIEEHSAALIKLARMKPGETIYQDLIQVVPVVHAALSRNYPRLSVDEVRDMLDMGNYRKVVDAVLGVSGLADNKEIMPGGESPVADRPRIQ